MNNTTIIDNMPSVVFWTYRCLRESPDTSGGRPENSINPGYVSSPTAVTKQPAYREDNDRHEHRRWLSILRLVHIFANGSVAGTIGESRLSQDRIADLQYHVCFTPGRRNIPADNKSVAAQASLRASHASCNPVRIGKGNTQRNVRRKQSMPSCSTTTKTSSPELCSKSKSYSIEVVQHPAKAAEFGNATLTRLPLAPPLIARLVVSEHADTEVVDDPELSFLVAQVSILSGHEPVVLSEITPGHVTSANAPRLLYGNLVSSPQILRNLQGRQGVYFLFPDVSVRVCGQYQLCVTLLRLPRPDLPEFMGDRRAGMALAQARSLPFDVFPREDYTAPAQTPLTQYFLQQGARMYAFAAPRPSSYRG